MSDKILSVEAVASLMGNTHISWIGVARRLRDSHEALRAERDQCHRTWADQERGLKARLIEALAERDAAREALRKIRDGIENDLRGPGAWAIGIASAALPDSVKTDP